MGTPSTRRAAGAQRLLVRGALGTESVECFGQELVPSENWYSFPFCKMVHAGPMSSRPCRTGSWRTPVVRAPVCAHIMDFGTPTERAPYERLSLVLRKNKFWYSFGTACANYRVSQPPGHNGSLDKATGARRTFELSQALLAPHTKLFLKKAKHGTLLRCLTGALF